MLYRFYQFLSSIRLAVVLLVMLAGILAAATYYESVYDTKTAQHIVYQSKIFALFLGLLFINIFCSTSIRYPWKKHQLGFVLTHLGILTLLIGSFVTMVAGVEGSLSVEEGRQSRRMLMDQPIFMVGEADQRMREIDAEFRWLQPTRQRPAKVDLGTVAGSALSTQVLQYVHHAKNNTYYADEASSNVAAVKLHLKNKRFDQVEWLTVGKGEMSLGPATVMLVRLPSKEAVQEFLSPPKPVEERGELQILVKGKPQRVPINKLKLGEWVDLEGGAYQLRLVEYLCHALPENGKLVNKSDKPVNPLAEVQVKDGAGNQQTWLLFARLPELNTIKKLEGKELPVRFLYSFEKSRAKHHLTVAIDHENKAYSQVDNRAGQPIDLARPYPTGWMDIEYSLETVVAHAREVKDFQEAPVEKGMESEAPSSAVLVQVEGVQRKEPFWLERGDVVELQTEKGQKVLFGYAYRSFDLGFSLNLKKFEIDYDPGSRNAAAYRSTVTVEGDQAEHLVQMNEPLVANGYRVFQSSFVDLEGQPKISIFTVAKDPGIGLKYLGSILLVGGIAIMFYIRPHQVRNLNQHDESTPQ